VSYIRAEVRGQIEYVDALCEYGKDTGPTNFMARTCSDVVKIVSLSMARMCRITKD
jgi:hypothetical protein